MGLPMMGGWLFCPEHNFVILNKNDLKFGMHVYWEIPECSAQEP